MSRRFLMCSLIYRNAQKQGPVTNMTLDEQSRASSHTTRSEEVVWVYRVWQHKTSGQFGSANLIVTVRVHKLLTEYTSKHRPTPQEGCEQYVFLTPQGCQVTHISDDLITLSKSFPTSLGVISVTATDMRKFTATHVAKEGATAETIRTVATHMTHSEDTARRYYQYQHCMCKCYTNEKH